jgi:hypothetical protein
MTGLSEAVVTVAETAHFFRVAQTTVWSWIERYALSPVSQRFDGKTGRYVNEYLFTVMAGAERRSRNTGRGRPRKNSVKSERFDHH